MKPTQRQIAALNFCERIFNVKFTGDRNCYRDVSNFLDEYLEEAKDMSNLYDEIQGDYWSYMADKDW